MNKLSGIIFSATELCEHCSGVSIIYRIKNVVCRRSKVDRGTITISRSKRPSIHFRLQRIRYLFQICATYKFMQNNVSRIRCMTCMMYQVPRTTMFHVPCTPCIIPRMARTMFHNPCNMHHVGSCETIIVFLSDN